MFVIKNNVITICKRCFGAISSGKRAAYYALLWKLIKPVGFLVDKILAGIAQKKMVKNEIKIGPCLLIVSPPRSGSTIIYQVLVRTIRCVYFSNLHSLLPQTASRFLRSCPLFGDISLVYQNYYGYTSSVLDVNEGNEAIAGILEDSTDLTRIRQNFIRFYQQLGASSDVPLIIKNVRTYDKLLLLHKAVPELVFLRIERNRHQVVQSVLRAYCELGTFHPIPAGLNQITVEDEVEFAVRQILSIEQSLKQQQEQISSDRWLTCSYEYFCQNAQIIVSKIAKDYLGLSASSYLTHNDFHLQASVSRKENDRAILLLQKLTNEYTKKIHG